MDTVTSYCFTAACIQIDKKEDGAKVYHKLNCAEGMLNQKQYAAEILKVFKGLNKNSLFAPNPNSDTPDTIRRTILEYIIPDEPIINSLVPSKKRC